MCGKNQWSSTGTRVVSGNVKVQRTKITTISDFFVKTNKQMNNKIFCLCCNFYQGIGITWPGDERVRDVRLGEGVCGFFIHLRGYLNHLEPWGKWCW